MSDQGRKNALKGADLEELLATYFRNAGYYVVRGVPFDYEGYSVTDVDLWLYIRASSVAREISVVDVKNKRTPQAIERIFWTKGLQMSLRIDRAIVATTDTRSEVQKFGNEAGVTVLDGKFLQRLQRSISPNKARLTDEQFDRLLSDETLGKLDGDWKGRLRNCKGRLVVGLTFGSVNYWIDHAQFFAEQIRARAQRKDLAFRCFYKTLAQIAIGLDYLLRDISFLEPAEKSEQLQSGFTYGDSGRRGVESTINSSLALLKQFGATDEVGASAIRGRVKKEFEAIPATILAEYFSRQDVGKELFHIAKEFDEFSMNASADLQSSLSRSARAMIGCLLDFWGYERKEFLVNDLHNIQSNDQVLKGK